MSEFSFIPRSGEKQLSRGIPGPLAGGLLGEAVLALNLNPLLVLPIFSPYHQAILHPDTNEKIFMPFRMSGELLLVLPTRGVNCGPSHMLRYYMKKTCIHPRKGADGIPEKPCTQISW